MTDHDFIKGGVGLFPNRFYTYAYLREDRTPYYIGKGQGKRLDSYLGKVPSVDFCDDAYHYFLHYASVEELEEDILKLQTLIKIGEALGNDLTQWGWDSCVWKDT